MAVAVVIPWRAGCPHRERALEWLRRGIAERHPGWDVVLGEQVEGEWCKALAVADGLARTDADTIIVHDADVWVPNLAEAVANCGTWAVPHLLVRRLTEAATDALIANGMPGAGLVRNPYKGFAGGGVTVVRRDVYESCPLDLRFRGWGQEDASWALALTCLYGPPWRGDSDLIHLWHPPQHRISLSTGSVGSRKLHSRYRRAAVDPTAMRDLLEDAVLSQQR